MRVQLVVNRNARRGRALGSLVMTELQNHGVDVVTAPNMEGIDAIVAAGGDGTFVRLIPEAMARNVPLGLIPLGTFNELARTLSIPHDIGAACALIAQRQRRTIDVGRVNGFYFVNEASIGISSRIARLQTPQDKQRFGPLAIVATSLQAFRHARPIEVDLRFDGQSEGFRTIQLTVANSHRFGGLFQVADAAIDDGWLDLYSIEIASFAEAFSVGRAIIAGKREPVPGLRTFRSHRFEVRTRRRHHITADGEPAGKTSAVFDILPKALDVFAPT